jgi:glyceraldehyde-3-phosphate dehydrogenase (NADP+)
MNFNKINTFNYINNQFENGLGNENLEVLDKYSGELLSQDQMASDEQAEKALKAANRAFSKLKKLSTEERRSALEKLYDLISEKKEDFIQLIIAEAGKPRSYATAEIERSLTTL